MYPRAAWKSSVWQHSFALSAKRLKLLCFLLRGAGFVRHDPVIGRHVFRPAADAHGNGGRNLMSLVRQLQNYRLTTAEILYHLPDHPALLQTYIWQDLDIAPQYPVLHKFLEFWKREIEGNLHSVRVASARLINPGKVRHAEALLYLH
jgi:uncharacterized protein Usg